MVADPDHEGQRRRERLRLIKEAAERWAAGRELRRSVEVTDRVVGHHFMDGGTAGALWALGELMQAEVLPEEQVLKFERLASRIRRPRRGRGRKAA